MTLLFKDIYLKHLPTILKTIVTMALEHGINLGLFVLAYKTGYKTLNHLIKPSSFNHFLSGLLFGTLIFGKKTGVNNQIVLYLLSRVMIGLATLAYTKLGQLASVKLAFLEKGYGYYLLSAVCWGTVMWLFEKERCILQPSLAHSMDFLYKESDTVERMTDLIPYFPKDKVKIKFSTRRSSLNLHSNQSQEIKHWLM